MSKILWLGTPRTEEDLDTYDFKDLDESNEDNDENDTDYDYGELDDEHPINQTITGMAYDDNYHNNAIVKSSDPTAEVYDFGDITNYFDRVIGEYLIKLFRDALRDATNDGSLKVKVNIMENPANQFVKLQWLLNTKSNKLYIEYDFNKNFAALHDIEAVIYNIKNYIHANLKREISFIPEILIIEDDYKVVDQYTFVTPYTVGYWKSVSGKYEFLIDEVSIKNKLDAIEFPKYPDEYYSRYDEIYNRYYIRNFNKFEDEIYKLKKEFRITGGETSGITFENFCKDVYELNKRYMKKELSNNEKNQYIEEYMQLYIEHHSDDNFEELVADLNTSYGLEASNTDDKVVELFTEYNNLYEQYFNVSLQDISNYTRRIYIELAYPLDSEQEENYDD